LSIQADDHVGDEGLKIKKFFKNKSCFCLTLPTSAALSFAVGLHPVDDHEGIYVLSNAYDRFSQLVRDLIEHIPSETIEIEEEASSDSAPRP